MPNRKFTFPLPDNKFFGNAKITFLNEHDSEQGTYSNRVDMTTGHLGLSLSAEIEGDALKGHFLFKTRLTLKLVDPSVRVDSGENLYF